MQEEGAKVGYANDSGCLSESINLIICRND
jgi:hypothetical protein